MSNSKENIQLLRELSKKYDNDNFTDAERKKMKDWKKLADELKNDIKSEHDENKH